MRDAVVLYRLTFYHLLEPFLLFFSEYYFISTFLLTVGNTHVYIIVSILKQHMLTERELVNWETFKHWNNNHSNRIVPGIPRLFWSRFPLYFVWRHTKSQTSFDSCWSALNSKDMYTNDSRQAQLDLVYQV